MKARDLRKLAVCLPLLLLTACNDDIRHDPQLARLNVFGHSGTISPKFDSKILDYGIPCSQDETLTVSAATSGIFDTISINGDQERVGSIEGHVQPSSPEEDIEIKVSSGKVSRNYTIHCYPDDTPEINVLYKAPQATSELIYLTPQTSVEGARKTHLLIVDNNGVPRFARTIDGSAVDWKRHPTGEYSYAFNIGTNDFGLADHEIVVYDDEFHESGRIRTVGLNHTDNHDAILLEDGGVILLSYHSTVRDMTNYGLGSQEIVGDSVIQELDSTGNIVMEWSSWDHIDLNDCLASGYPRFPDDYAHINSISLTPDDEIIASLRGCGQILKIDRPTGNVMWYLGGSRSNYTIVGDNFGEFCGQHTAWQLSSDRVLLFDNGSFCLGEREANFGQFSRAVEYRLDDLTNEAHFVRDYSRDHIYADFSRSQGSVQQLNNGNWVIGWGAGPNVAVTEVNARGEKLLELSLTSDGSVIVSYRAFVQE